MAESPLPHLPHNPLGELPSNPLGKPPTIGSRGSGGGRRRHYRSRSPLPNLTRKAPGRSPSETAQAQQNERKIIHIHEHRNAPPAEESTPAPAASSTPREADEASPKPTAAERRETKQAGLRVRDREYVAGLPAEHQERMGVLFNELTHRATQQHRAASLQAIDDMIQDERRKPRRQISPRGRLRRRKVDESATPRTPEQQAHRDEQWQQIRALANELHDDTQESEE